MKDELIQKILNEFKFLEKDNFKLEIIDTTPMFKDDVSDKEIYYSNDKVKIKVWIGNFVNGDLLTISIFKLGENKCFSFDEYLLSKSIESFKSHANECTDDYIARIANLFHKEIKSELKDVLNGKKWIEVPKDYSRIR